ncbi:formimidoylglutamase [soil metagenome]
MNVLEATDVETRFTKNDFSDVRLGDVLQFNDSSHSLSQLKSLLSRLPQSGFTLVGYPDDAGIQANGGRIGAKLGPSRIRHFFSRMTPPAFGPAHNIPALLDLGNVPLVKDLATRHEFARAIADEVHQHRARAISFGGGHDYGFPDAAAFCRSTIDRGERPLVINFDAHLDVRPLNNGITSGTPFFRLLEEFPQIDFLELGLQGQCNSRAHVEWLKSRGGRISFEEERHAANESLTQVLSRETATFKNDRRRVAFLSVDIDAFSSAVAPGASQSWPTGFEPTDFFNCFSWCLKSFDVRGVGIYEVSPPLDLDDRTSRLAALIAHRFVFQSS